MEITMGTDKAAKLLGVSVETLQRWGREGRYDQSPALPRKPSGGAVLRLQDREWICLQCSTRHDRDLNAALDLKRLATATALPVASPSGNGGTAAERIYAAGGKVTPVRYE
jgi:transposase